MINILSQTEIALMQESGKILREVLFFLEEKCIAGITTAELNRFAGEMIQKHNAKAAFLGVKSEGTFDYPGNICISINQEVVHGIPGKRVIMDGDIVSVDCGVNYKGWITDAAHTFAVGNVSDEARRLIEYTEKSFFAGLEKVREGNRIGDVSAAIEKVILEGGYSAVRDLQGHGVGKSLHEDPAIPNFVTPRKGPRMQAGMSLAIEPMVNIGGYEVGWLDDGWTVETIDDSLSAHYENTVIVTKDEPLVVTL